MNILKRTTKNFFSLSIGKIISQIITFVTIVYLARILGPENFGKINFAQVVVLYFMLITSLGLPTLGVREVARDKNNISNYVNNLLTLRLILALFSFCLMLGFVSIIHKSVEVKYLIIFYGLSLFPFALGLEWLFRGIERMEFIGISMILNKISYGILIFALVRNAGDLLTIPFFWVGGNVVGVMFLIYIFIKYFGKIRLKFNFSLSKNLMKKALPMGTAIIMTQIYYNFDTVMLGFMKEDRVVGWYNAAYKIILFIWAFIPLFVDTIFPLMSRYYKESKEKLKTLISSSTRLLSTIALPIGVGGTILAKPIMNFLYPGGKFDNGIIVFQILIWSIVIISVRCIYEQSFLACDREKRYLLGVIIGAITNIGLNAILIPLFSLTGAAIATVISELTFSLYMLFYFRIIKRRIIGKHVLKPSLAAIFMGIIVYYMKGFNLFFSVSAGMVSYLAIILLIKGVTFKEINWWREEITRREYA